MAVSAMPVPTPTTMTPPSPQAPPDEHDEQDEEELAPAEQRGDRRADPEERAGEAAGHAGDEPDHAR